MSGTTASWALQRAIHSALVNDATLTGLIGDTRIYDHVPRGTAYPYVTFGQTTERDWSTGGAEGNEHVVTLAVWSQARGRREMQRIIAAIRTALHESDLTINGYRLVNLRHELTETRRETDGDTLRGLVRFRAVTEAD
ncbi:MAG: DUF3168 domain-containing protein [Pseudomonadota bacterium]